MFWNIFFIVKTPFITHKFTWIHINLHDCYTYVLECIFWRSNYFGVYGCWLLWLLLYVSMVGDWLVLLLICLTVLFYQELKIRKIIFFSQSSHHKQSFCNIDNTHFTPLKDLTKAFVQQMRNDKWQMTILNLIIT